MISFCIAANKEPVETIASIKTMDIPDVEILVGRTGGLTVKKNRLIRQAKHDIVVVMHDYLIFDPEWYNTISKETRDWNVMMNQIINTDGTRYRDWCNWDDPSSGDGWMISVTWGSHWALGHPCLVPYDYNKTNYMYISGAYWVAKKQFMLDNPLNEEIEWGDGEDVEWSYRARKTWKYIYNPAIVRLGKNKDVGLKYKELSND